MLRDYPHDPEERICMYCWLPKRLDGKADCLRPIVRHLFVRGQYVHPIVFAPDGQIFLKDVAAFNGTRHDFTTDEITALRTLYAQVQSDEATRTTAKQAAQATNAQRVLASQDAKLAGMDDVKIYD